MSEPAHAISIPSSSGPSAFRYPSFFSPNTMTSPTMSIASPFSSSSGGSLGRMSGASSGAGHTADSGPMLGSSFATTVSAFSDGSPPRGDVKPKVEHASDDGEADADVQSVAGTEESGQVRKHKPHKCDVCGACFARKVHLQRHSLRHQVCKPYCCDRCNKCFSRQDSLVRHHRLLHEKPRPDKKGAIDKGKNATASCVRCSSIAVPCDGRSPCGRCMANHGGQSCVYAPTSSPLTIGAATAKSMKRTKKQQRTIGKAANGMAGSDSASTATASDAPSWATYGRGHRRDTVSSVASGWSDASAMGGYGDDSHSIASQGWNMQQMQSTMPPLYGQQHQLQQWQLQQLHAQQIDTNHGGEVTHPFDMMHIGSASQAVEQSHAEALQRQGMDMDGVEGNFVPQLLSLLGASGQETPVPRGHASQNATTALQNIDWNSMLQNLQQSNQHAFGQDAARLPFTGAASDKSVNATLFGNMETDYASPSTAMPNYGLEPSMPVPSQGAEAMNGADCIALSSLGIPVPPSLNFLPANLQMSADGWDNFMRCLSSYAMTRGAAQPGQDAGRMAPGLGGVASPPMDAMRTDALSESATPAS